MLRKQSKNHFKGSFNIPNPEEAIFSFDIRVYLLDNSRNKLIDQKYKESKIGHNYFIYYGKNVNDIYLKSESIEGQLKDFRINSKNLDTTRSLTVYYPKHYNSITPIIYFTDGSNVIDYAKYVDKMISTGKIKPVILAGVHSSKNNRYFEYVQGDSNNTHFLNHERFFLHDVLNFIEHNIQNWKGKRYMYGVSNGGAFCIYMGINYPSLFKDIIAFSTADYITEFERPIHFSFKEYPGFYLGAGFFEKDFYNDNKMFYSKLIDNKIDAKFKTFKSGHDFNVWRFEFLLYLLNEFKNE